MLSVALVRHVVVLLSLAGSSTLWCADRSVDSPRDAITATYTTVIRPMLSTFCGDCHNSERHKGDLDLSPLMGKTAALEQMSVWQKVGSKVVSHEMPPAKSTKQPSESERESLLTWLKASRRLQAPDPGTTLLRRLSRSEYTNTINALFGVSVDAGADLAADRIGAGFDNSLSPLLAEKYLLAADAVLDRFIAADQMSLHLIAGQLPALIAGKEVAGNSDGASRQFSTPAEIFTTATFPDDGSYVFRIKAGAEAAGGEPIRLAIRIDGMVVGDVTVKAQVLTKANYTCTIKSSAGRKNISLLYVNPKAIESTEKTNKASTGKSTAAKTRSVEIDSIEILGPPAKMPSEVQRRLFVSVPSEGVSRHDAAKRILEPFATRAFRRPLRAEELTFLLGIFDIGDSQDLVFSEAIKLAMKAILISPQFLYRTPEELPGENAQDIIAIGDYELANRLSYFLWGTMPDAELFRCAQDRTLHRPEVLAAQAKRLITDPRIRHLATAFAAPWLNLDKLPDLTVDQKRFPMMTKDLRQAMYEEGIAFFLGLLDRENRITDVIDSDYAYMNALTAKIYDIADVKGTKMQKVVLSDMTRGGVITMPGVLAVTSMPSRTSPVKRGKFILEQLLDETPPPPPANVPELNTQKDTSDGKLTLRQLTEQHRADPACAGCHRVMDPLGFGLENFDAIGRWRDRDDVDASVDAAGELPGKLRFNSPSDLRKILMQRKDVFVCTITRKLLMFSLGRPLSGYDEVVVDDLADAVIANGYHLEDLIQRIISSYPFLHRHTIK